MPVVPLPYKKAILVTGPVADLSFSNKEKIGKILTELCNGFDFTDVLILHGNAVGVDRFADKWGRDNKCHVRAIDYYRNYGKLGGFYRNQELCLLLSGMKFFGISTIVAAFPSKDFKTSGTQNCIDFARSIDLDVHETKIGLLKAQVRMRKRCN